MGFLRTRSTPSLVAGLGLGASYAYAGSSFLSVCILPPCFSYLKLLHNDKFGHPKRIHSYPVFIV